MVGRQGPDFSSEVQWAVVDGVVVVEVVASRVAEVVLGEAAAVAAGNILRLISFHLFVSK